MCLAIDWNYHKPRRILRAGKYPTAYKAFVAKTNLFVHKLVLLPREGEAGDCVSYVRRSPYFFGQVKESPMSDFVVGGTVIEEGLHAFLFDPYFQGHAFPAIIPERSKVWYGGGKQIASNRMIVFQSMDALREEYDFNPVNQPLSNLVKVS